MTPLAMDPEQRQLLSLAILPARLNSLQAAHVLGFQHHDIRTLVAAGLLRPLGRPAPNSTKYFAAVELEQLRADVKWLARATDAVRDRWRHKNHSDPAPIAQGRRSAHPLKVRFAPGSPLTASATND